jgi:AcrR family transcriptional regulator
MMRNEVAASKYALLNRAAIVAAARAIADSEGLDRVTLRRVAEALGTGQASLYRHIAGRAELVARLADDLAAGFPRVPDEGPTTVSDGEDATETVVRQWRATHRYLTEHSWGAQAIAAGDQLAGTAHEFTEHAIGQLRALGLEDQDAARAYRALWHLLMGHLLSDHPFGHGHASAAHPRNETDLDWAIRALVSGITNV